ncbi:DNA repair protein RadA [Candidatus Saccharibacteria bacterium]|nr:DNA repair protein RadA [Candidatus Saccharibacteria bacterium]
MAKTKTSFVCQQCAATYPKWSGRCENCGAWNSLVEQMPQEKGNAAVFRSSGKALEPQPLSASSGKAVPRIAARIGDIDAVLGGGFVPGSVVLLAGQPGIGKSTILAQVAAQVAADKTVLYISGEESLEQVAGRVQRLKANHENVSFISTNSADDVAATIRQAKYDVVVLDSIQTMALAELSSAPGSVSQITNTTNVLTMAAKQSNTTLIMIGHVTKEGSIAGPKVLEHLVDVVLSIDGDRYAGFKVLRALKNRYGSTTEAAVFEMDQSGLKPVANPSAALLAERQTTDGSVVLATMEGNRPLLVEIQALVTTTSFGYPKRTASGFDLNRLNVLIAVIERRTNLKLSEKDVYINVVGGIKLQDPGADLAICMAIASAAAQRQLQDDAVVFGEVGLAGEVRSTTGMDRRLNEAMKLGFTTAITPPSATAVKGINVVAARNLRDTLIAHLQK